MTPPLVTLLVNNGASREELLTSLVDRVGEQNEQISLNMSGLKRADHVERESLRKEISRNRQEVSRSKKHLKERTDEHLARNLSRMTGQAEETEKRLRGDLEQLRSQQEQALGTLDTRIDAMMERRTQTIMDRLDGLLGNKSGSEKSGAHSREASREPRVNFKAHSIRERTYASTKGRCSPSSGATGNNRPRNPMNTRGGSNGSRPVSNEWPMRDEHANRRGGSSNWNHTNQRTSQTRDSERRDVPEPQTTDEKDRTGYSRNATAFEALNRYLETFLTRLSRNNERSE